MKQEQILKEMEKVIGAQIIVVDASTAVLTFAFAALGVMTAIVNTWDAIEKIKKRFQRRRTERYINELNQLIQNMKKVSNQK